MANNYSDATVYNCEVKACKTFYGDQLPTVTFYPLAEKDVPDNVKRFKGRPIYDITGLDAHQVVSVLSIIVNDRDQFKENKTFYLLIKGNQKDDLEELFRLKAKPAPATHQPGNGIVFLRPRGRTLFERNGAKSYEGLNGALKAFYPDTYDDKGRLILGTTSFARDIKQLFKNNARNKDIPQATFEAYMILLFEIARRLVKSVEPTETQVEYDVLPIGSAIVRIVKLLELGKCRFEDVFFTGHTFHCFSKGPEVRRKAIANINQAILDITKESTAPVVVYVTNPSHLLHPLLSTSSAQAIAEQNMTKKQLKELQEMFCSEERLAEMSFKEEEELAAEFKKQRLFQVSDLGLLQKGLRHLTTAYNIYLLY